MSVLALAMALAGVASPAVAAPDAPAPPVPADHDGAPTSTAKEKELTPLQLEAMGELEQASQYLKAGENGSDEAERRRNYELSAAHAERAVELDPDSADAHFILFGAKGRVAQMGGLASAALALSSLNGELDEVLRLDPTHSDALAARGGMLMKLPRLMGGDTTEGVRYLERATELNPTGAGTRLELAEAYAIVGRDAEALRAGRESIAIAEKKGEVEKAERARAFVAQLEKSCDGCAMAATAE